MIGSGNVNDLDLHQVLRAADHVHLVDLDREATVDGVGRQGVPADRVTIHGCDAFSAQLPFADRSFDAVLSAGALTQAFQSVLDGGGSIDAVLDLRDRHLVEMTRLLRDGGTALLVTDTVATSTAPELLHTRDDELEPAMAALVAARNFFTGTNAYRIVAVLEEDPRLAAAITDVTLHDPWLWAVTLDRSHLAYAITWRRR